MKYDNHGTSFDRKKINVIDTTQTTNFVRNILYKITYSLLYFNFSLARVINSEKWIHLNKLLRVRCDYMLRYSVLGEKNSAIFLSERSLQMKQLRVRVHCKKSKDGDKGTIYTEELVHRVNSRSIVNQMGFRANRFRNEFIIVGTIHSLSTTCSWHPV